MKSDAVRITDLTFTVLSIVSENVIVIGAE